MYITSLEEGHWQSGAYLVEEFRGANVLGGVDPAGLVAGGEPVVLGAAPEVVRRPEHLGVVPRHQHVQRLRMTQHRHLRGKERVR